MKRSLLILTAMLAALLLGSGVAMAGTNGNDTRNGTANRDVMYGPGGSDRLHGRAGNDEIDGGPGNGTNLTGSTSIDDISGGAGADTINGGDRFDLIFGDFGDDNIRAGGSPSNFGGEDDIVSSFNSGDEVYGGSGDDRLFTDDDRQDYVDCGEFSGLVPPSGSDFDTADEDDIALGDLVGDTFINCESTI